jgi:S-adenosylmethionine:tRNA ribosyltransferase-isomerase
MQTSELQYDLPTELIAQRPVEPRDASRLMIVDRNSGTWRHAKFAEIVGCFTSGDCLVRNTTKVIPAKFAARRESGAQIGGLFLREIAPGQWSALLSNTRRVRDGEWLQMDGGPWRIAIESRGERGECTVRVDPPAAATVVLEAVGETPLPPYIRRDDETKDAVRAEDRSRYQTVFAQSPGAVAAPTAGLHFTPELLSAIESRGVAMADVTLHVGMGTFQPIEVDNLRDHVMHREWYELTDGAAATIARTREQGGRIVAVGTTSVRVLESVAAVTTIQAASGWTDILIYPPYSFGATDALLTNFHLPGSTLLALVCAFAGRDLTLAAYADAVRERYRFFSYGDAMLIM